MLVLLAFIFVSDLECVKSAFTSSSSIWISTYRQQKQQQQQLRPSYPLFSGNDDSGEKANLWGKFSDNLSSALEKIKNNSTSKTKMQDIDITKENIDEDKMRLSEAQLRQQAVQKATYADSFAVGRGTDVANSDDSLQQIRERIEARRRNQEAFVRTKENIYNAIDTLSKTAKDISELPDKIAVEAKRTKETVISVSQEVQAIPQKTQQKVKEIQTTVEKGIETVNNVVEDAKTIPSKVEKVVADVKAVPDNVRNKISGIQSSIDNLTDKLKPKETKLNSKTVEMDKEWEREVDEALQAAEEVFSERAKDKQTQEKSNVETKVPFFISRQEKTEFEKAMDRAKEAAARISVRDKNSK